MIKYPFVIISDVHCNDWSAFSSVGPGGINSRLEQTLSAIEEAVFKLTTTGGNDLIITGDLFHTRGKMKPSVFNPVFDYFVGLCKHSGINVHFLPGNHDLEGKNSDRVGNVAASFEEIDNFHVYNTVTELGEFVFVPWIDDKDEFVKTINKIENPKDKVVFCHIGIDGVLDQVAGKVGKAVFERGFRYVFSGDYHNHKALGNGIYSVGALTHHSFGDIGSTAGYLLVHEDEVEQHETNAPKFVAGPDLYSAKGNIIRLEGIMSEKDAEREVKAHYDAGAIFVQDLTSRQTLKETSSSTSVIRVDVNLDVALESYCKNKYGVNYEEVWKEVKRLKDEHV